MKPRHLITCRAVFLLLLLGVMQAVSATPVAHSQEVQQHGLVFERWVQDTFFDGYRLDNYTQEWDVAKGANKKYGGLPVSIKFTKYGSPVGLGDALRQFQINEDFLLIIGYWKQEGERKRIVNIVSAVVTPKLYQSLWQPITLNDLKTLDAAVKNRASDAKQARLDAKNLKAAPPFTKAVMTVNPKIDSKIQRRLQCSLRFRYVFERLAPKADPSAQQKPTLFGIAAPEPFLSSPRSSS